MYSHHSYSVRRVINSSLRNESEDNYFIFTIMNDKEYVTSFYDKDIAELYYSLLKKDLQVYLLSTDNLKELERLNHNWFFDTKEFIEYYNILNHKKDV